MQAKLYVILGSHACRTGMLLLEHKGIEYKRVELPTGLHPVLLRLLGFAGNDAPFRDVDGHSPRQLGLADRMGTVPSLRMDGHRVKTGHGIACFLEELRPEPPLFPANPEHRKAVEEAERWGDDVFQMAARRLTLAAAMHDPDGLVADAADGRLGPLLWKRTSVRRFGVRRVARLFEVDAGAADRLRAELPGMLDRIDGWIDAGVLNGERLYVADFVIAPSLALLTYSRDFRAQIESRPALRLIDRVLPEPALAG